MPRHITIFDMTARLLTHRHSYRTGIVRSCCRHLQVNMTDYGDIDGAQNKHMGAAGAGMSAGASITPMNRGALSGAATPLSIRWK